MSDNRILLCGIGKLENNYIREWVEYHKKLGFTNIVLYDNNDVDGEKFEDVIGDYIKSGYVILKNWRGKELAQIPSYNSCYAEYKDKYDWIGFWDIDEFIQFDKSKTIQEFVNQKIFEKIQCIRICWKQYTDNGILKTKGDYSIKKFKEVFDKDFCKKHKIPIQRYIATNTQAKSIVRTNIKDFNVTSPHCFLKVPTVNATGKKCEIGIKLGNTPIWSGAWLNHYRFKTLEEYVTKKMVRLWPTKYMNGGKDRLNLDYFFMFNKKTPEKVKYAKSLIENLDEKNICINTWTLRDKNDNLVNRNWGDELNYYFLSKLFSKKLVEYNETDVDNYSLIGSIANLFTDNHTIIWGSGIQVDRELKGKPKKVCAVRGPLTRKFFIEINIKCPEIYGDPSLLLPYYYYPDIPKKYEIGYIPHWSSIDSLQTRKFIKDKRVHLIKLKGYKNWLTVIDEILSCKYIISESLHGLIMAEAYGVPNLWVDVTLKNIFDIKYHDFFQSIGMDREKPYKLDGKFTVDTALKYLKDYKKGTMPDLNKLVDACPIQITNKEFLDRVRNNKIVKTKKVKMDNEYESGISVCITAYKAKEFIKETLDSVAAQTWFKTHDNWEILVGVDGCKETLDYLKTIMGNYSNLRVFMMSSNQGTYVTTNTIMSLAKYDGLIRFDSDDIMLPEMVETIMKEKGSAEFVNFKMENFGKNNHRKGVMQAGGQVYVSHKAFDKFGGYLPWTCSADTEFEMRMRKFVNSKMIAKVLMRRRLHSNNLTVAKATNFSSEIRKKNLKYCRVVTARIKKEEDAKIQKITNGYYEVFSDGTNTEVKGTPIQNLTDSDKYQKIKSETMNVSINSLLKQNEALRKYKAKRVVYGSNSLNDY